MVIYMTVHNPAILSLKVLLAHDSFHVYLVRVEQNATPTMHNDTLNSGRGIFGT